MLLSRATIIYLSFSIIISSPFVANAQVEIDLPEKKHSMLDVDTSFIKSYRYHITSRLYASRKYTMFTLPGTNNQPYLFRPNNTFNLGVGWTYRGFTLNLGYGFPFVNGDGSLRGKTKNLDLQMHMYARKQVIDVYGQFYKGFYNNPGLVPQQEGFYSDPNTDMLALGFNYTRILNHKRYSIRQGANHDERQLKSAGSFLYGVEGIYNRIKNDTQAIVLDSFQQLAQFHKVHRFQTFNIGPNLGYGYNWVIAQHFFVGGAATVGTTFSYFQQEGITKQQFSTFSKSGNTGIIYIAPTAALRLSAGYNSDRWALIGYYVHQTSTTFVGPQQLMSNGIGNFRINLVYRFLPNKWMKKVLKPYEWVFK